MRWALPATLLLAACQQGAPNRDATVAVFSPNYGAVETRLLADDLVQFDLSMQGARTAQDVADYADCVAAEYTLIRGLAFVRHVRTNLDIPTRQDTGIWRADAVYTVSPDLPRGRQTIDAISRVEDCRDRGIPTV